MHGITNQVLYISQHPVFELCSEPLTEIPAIIVCSTAHVRWMATFIDANADSAVDITLSCSQSSVGGEEVGQVDYDVCL